MKRKEIGFCGPQKTPEKYEKKEDRWQQMKPDKRPFLDLNEEVCAPGTKRVHNVPFPRSLRRRLMSHNTTGHK
jgi:hypothetical protein